MPFRFFQEGKSEKVASLKIIRRAAETGRPMLVELDGTLEAEWLLDGTRSQLAIPIRREQKIIGILFLESRAKFSDPAALLGSLTRLSDHAAIAIANARLYEEVKAANMAKSQFVSFVAHELKNPMASIKGYTELVAGGMAGPVNEMQSGFLGTVRSNVDRMNTIVSDLNDLTKIQVGNLSLNYRALNLSQVLDEVVSSLSSQIKKRISNCRSCSRTTSHLYGLIRRASIRSSQIC